MINSKTRFTCSWNLLGRESCTVIYGLVVHSAEGPVSVPVSFFFVCFVLSSTDCDGDISHARPFLTVFYFFPSLSLLDEEKKCMLLVMRVLSIVPLNFKVR